MRKLLHLVFAVWKTNRPFDERHFAWEPANDTQASETQASDPQASDTNMSTPAPADTHVSTPPPAEPVPVEAVAANHKAVGHKRDKPAPQVVTTATSSVNPSPPSVNPATPAPPTAARPQVDFAFLRQHITMEQVLRHLGCFEPLRGRGQQRRGLCPVHGQRTDTQRTFSVHLGKNIYQCFQADCAVHGNVLDLWAALHRVPLYEAALHLAETFHVPRNREEERVN